MFKYTDYITFKELLVMLESNYCFAENFLKEDELEYATLLGYGPFYPGDSMGSELRYVHESPLPEDISIKLSTGLKECLSTRTT